MKKIICLMLILSLLLGLAACGAPAMEKQQPADAPTQEATEPTQEPPEETPEVAPEPTTASVVEFTDDVLEELVRQAMNKSEGDITVAEAEAVTDLDLQMEGGTPAARVKDIDALKYFTNLTGLNLNWALADGGNDINISALAGLTKLEKLYFCCDNVADISALAGMVNMRDLQIWGNQITDISALADMTGLEDLWIKGNQISDISALAGMKNLWRICMEDNQIVDITPLSELGNLKSLTLSGNPIEDYSPLADIYPNLTEKDFKLK